MSDGITQWYSLGGNPSKMQKWYLGNHSKMQKMVPGKSLENASGIGPARAALLRLGAWAGILGCADFESAEAVVRKEPLLHVRHHPMSERSAPIE